MVASSQLQSLNDGDLLRLPDYGESSAYKVLRVKSMRSGPSSEVFSGLPHTLKRVVVVKMTKSTAQDSEETVLAHWRT